MSDNFCVVHIPYIGIYSNDAHANVHMFSRDGHVKRAETNYVNKKVRELSTG